MIFSKLNNRCYPAYVTNQVSKQLNSEKKFYIKQVSDNPRNIEDKADNVELKAINFFKQNRSAKEFFEIHKPDQFLKEKHIWQMKELNVFISSVIIILGLCDVNNIWEWIF